MAVKIAPKIIVLSLFEPVGEIPGEQTLFKERLGFSESYEIPGAMGKLFINSDGVGALLLGIGATKPAISLMALGYDERFDLRHTYFLIAGIAGADPHVTSIGSVAWARFAVDGNLAFEIDSREIPAHWPTGLFPLGSNEPYEIPYRGEDGVFLKDEVFELNDGLKNWAYQLTKDVLLQDSECMREGRALYTDTPAAMKAPCVLLGDVLASERFWHGKYFTEWAERWVKLWTEGKGTFAMSTMEEMGALRGFAVLKDQGKLEFDRIMVVRSASNFCMQPPSKTAVENITSKESEEDRFPAYLPSLENLYRVASVVVGVIVANWDSYKTKVPGF
ncbi:MAG: purine nucleoside permease [Verrucomicrobia bacterium]|nr:purine nucleoside permease [Verrucomicrobiota bacterium]MDA1065193.1 purine nucleoside permease [Verrucomicrobiota bacterium]